MNYAHNRHADTICVLVADNSRFHAQLIVEVLKRDPGLRVMSSDLEAASLVAASINQKIDIFILSASGDGDVQRGAGILQQLRETNPNARAVMLLGSSKPEAVLVAFRAGAGGVFDHRESCDVLCQCIHKVHAGGVLGGQPPDGSGTRRPSVGAQSSSCRCKRNQFAFQAGRRCCEVSG